MSIKYLKENLAGQKFGRWTAIKTFKKTNNNWTVRYWYCICECGNKKSVTQSALLRGKSQSCGCKAIEMAKRRIMKWNKSTPHNGVNSVKWKGVGEMPGSYICQLKAGAKNRKIKFNLTKQELWEKFIQQKRKCAISGLCLKFDKGYGNASVDRINSKKSYKISNIQWVHKDVNKIKGELTERKFFKYCRLIATHTSSIPPTNILS